MDTKSGKNSFSIGQPVVYPQQGLGIIQAIRERIKDGVSILYYAIYLSQSDMTLLIPVDRAKEMGVRSIVSRDEALKAIDSMAGKAESLPADWKLRYQRNQELIRTEKAFRDEAKRRLPFFKRLKLRWIGGKV